MGVACISLDNHGTSNARAISRRRALQAESGIVEFVVLVDRNRHPFGPQTTFCNDTILHRVFGNTGRKALPSDFLTALLGMSSKIGARNIAGQSAIEIISKIGGKLITAVYARCKSVRRIDQTRQFSFCILCNTVLIRRELTHPFHIVIRQPCYQKVARRSFLTAADDRIRHVEP